MKIIHMTEDDLKEAATTGFAAIPPGGMLYVVGCCRPLPEQWEFVGVFSTPELAAEACTGPEYFVGPMPINWRTPDATMQDWYGSWFPQSEPRPW